MTTTFDALENTDHKLLTFFCGSHEYGIPISEAREVIGIMPIDHIPKSPKYIKGVINLRGKIIPVIHLRTKLGMQDNGNTKETCIIVVEFKGELTGVIVDNLIGVVNIEQGVFEEKPEVGREIHQYISGLTNLEGRVIIILDLTQLLTY